ncbi:MAG: flagellar basal body rod protein FlgC, partial [Methylobacterium sp.]
HHVEHLHPARAVAAVMDDASRGDGTGGVQVLDVVQSTEPLRQAWEPGHPLADENGMVFYPNVNPVAETVDMMSASRAFETNVEVLGRVKAMQQSLLKLGDL